jgi:hypothetical protein
VISAAASALYVVVAMQTIATNPVYSQLLYALDLGTGLLEIQPSGVEFAGQGSSTQAFNSTFENQRPALLLDNGTIYVAFGSRGGQGDYHGWLFGYDSASLKQTGVLEVTPDAGRGEFGRAEEALPRIRMGMFLSRPATGHLT